MEELSQKITSPIKKNFKENANMTSTIAGGKSFYVNSEIHNSIMRGEILRYSQYLKEVRKYLNSLKQSNPKYLDLLVKILCIATQELPALDVELRGYTFESLLEQFNSASYNNHEALDFTIEILNVVDVLTAKYYLAHLSGGILLNNNLKKQFKASIPFIKIVYNSLEDSLDLTKQVNFMNAIKIIINEKADSEKIALLPRIKYLVDKVSKNNHPIDVTTFIYSKEKITNIDEKLEALANIIRVSEKTGTHVDCVSYLIQNSL